MIVIIVARKPFKSPVVDNISQWGTGGLNIKDCRIGGNSGRFPSNVILEHKPQCVNNGLQQITGGRTDIRPEKSESRTSTEQWRFKPTNKTKRGYADMSGIETIDDWSCVDDCPVGSLNSSIGIKKSGTMKRFWDDSKNNLIYSQPNSRWKESAGSVGYVSRFFKQIQLEPDYYRSSGKCICRICGKPYSRHPIDSKLPFLNVLCNGDRVKL